jgi:hypothetical protein
MLVIYISVVFVVINIHTLLYVCMCVRSLMHIYLCNAFSYSCTDLCYILYVLYIYFIYYIVMFKIWLCIYLLVNILYSYLLIVGEPLVSSLIVGIPNKYIYTNDLQVRMNEWMSHFVFRIAMLCTQHGK